MLRAFIDQNGGCLQIASGSAFWEFQRGKEFLARLDEFEKPDLDKREVFRGIFDGRYKLVRYFGLAHYNLPQSVEELLANNDVALYDLQNDPEEMNNLADPENPNYDEELVASINDKLNALIADEIGDDRGMRERLIQA